MQPPSVTPTPGSAPLATPRARQVTFATAFVGLVLFCLIAWAAQGAETNLLSRIDAMCAAWAARHLGAGWVPLMRGVSLLHGTAGTLVLTALLGLVLYRRAEWWWWRCLLLTVPGGMLLNGALKLMFQRARPTGADPLYLPHSFSFPSGHATYVCLFYGFLVVWLFDRSSRPPSLPRYVTAIGTMAASVMCLAVGASRVGLGVHYASDVLAGAVEAFTWLAVCLMLTEFFVGRAHYGTTA
jgi:membrane-associated phospholipid phosphatase